MSHLAPPAARPRAGALLPNGELKSLVLYGSQVCGKARPDSDIDLFLVYDHVTPEQEKTLEEFTTDLFFANPRIHIMTFNPAKLAQQATGLDNLLCGIIVSISQGMRLPAGIAPIRRETDSL